LSDKAEFYNSPLVKADLLSNFIPGENGKTFLFLGSQRICENDLDE